MLNDDVAILTDGDAARDSPPGILAALERSGAGRVRSATARAELADTKYSYEAYLDAHAAGLRRT